MELARGSNLAEKPALENDDAVPNMAASLLARTNAAIRFLAGTPTKPTCDLSLLQCNLRTLLNIVFELGIQPF